MLTKTKLNIYKKYKGDGDMWIRAGNKKLLKDSDWREIDSLIQDLRLIKNEFASEFYASEVKNKLNEICENQETIELLNQLASEKNIK